MSARLTITMEDGLRLELELGGRPVTIGRAEGNVVRSDDRRVSRHHAEVRRQEDGGYTVSDAGSTYGLTLNGRAVQKGEAQRLAHMDIINAGGIQAQFFAEDVPEEIDTEGPTGAFSQSELAQAERGQLRDEVQTLIEEAATLRKELGKCQESLGRAEKDRDASREEAARLQAMVAEGRGEVERLTARLDALGAELRNERSSKEGGGGGEEVARLQRQLGEASRHGERLTARIAELEEREAGLVLKMQELKKEAERLQELNLKREKREAELTQAVKPALLRVAQLQQELEKKSLRLAQAEADLAELKKR